MALEVREHDEEVVIVNVFADNVFFKVFAAFDRELDFAFGIEDVYAGEVSETVFFCCRKMGFGSVAVTDVCCVTFDECAVDKSYKVSDERGVEMV